MAPPDPFPLAHVEEAIEGSDMRDESMEVDHFPPLAFERSDPADAMPEVTFDAVSPPIKPLIGLLGMNRYAES
jgi:hypothetical protein